MVDLLPTDVRAQVGSQYRTAVKEAADRFHDQRDDEDSVTGALGQALAQNVHGTFSVAGGSWRWLTRSRKIRGRGPKAPEKRFGLDAIIELEVWDNLRMIGKKSLPIQSKIDWRGRDKRLLSQAEKIALLEGNGLIVNYTAGGYWATPASTAVEAGGDPKAIAPAQYRDLGIWLQTDFLICTIGTRAVYYDAEREILIHVDKEGRTVAESIYAGHRILTRMERFS